MTINSLKDLEKLVKLCRRMGVQAIKVDGIEFGLGPVPQSRVVKAAIDTEVFPEANIRVPTPNIQETVIEAERIATPDELTEDQLLFYSARPEDSFSVNS